MDPVLLARLGDRSASLAWLLVFLAMIGLARPVVAQSERGSEQPTGLLIGPQSAVSPGPEFGFAAMLRGVLPLQGPLRVRGSAGGWIVDAECESPPDAPLSCEWVLVSLVGAAEGGVELEFGPELHVGTGAGIIELPGGGLSPTVSARLGAAFTRYGVPLDIELQFQRRLERPRNYVFLALGLKFQTGLLSTAASSRTR